MDTPLCSQENCGKERYARGLCQKHYQAHKDQGGFGTKKCTFPGCPSYMRAKSLCLTHYNQQRLGRTLTAVKQPRPVGEWGPWYRLNTGYTARSRRVEGGGQETQLEHRYVMSQMIGRELTTEDNVHHKNGDRSDNRPENLELWTTKQPKGQRVSDRIRDALWVIETYGSNPEMYELR